MCFVFVGWWLESHVFFFGGRSRLPKIYGSPIPDFFLGGGTPKIVGKTRISGKSFWRGPQDSGKK